MNTLVIIATVFTAVCLAGIAIAINHAERLDREEEIQCDWLEQAIRDKEMWDILWGKEDV